MINDKFHPAMGRVAYITTNIIDFLKPYGPLIEIGAGDGEWVDHLRRVGVDIIGFDPNPRGPAVAEGDHTVLQNFPDRVPLIVWPPDGTDIGVWLAGRSRALIAGPTRRFILPEEFTVAHSIICHGFKGGHLLGEYVR